MPEPHDSPDGLEAMAFQLLLHKITGLEHAIQSLPPLLKKIIDQLEAQTHQPDVPIATYAQLYPELHEDGAEEQAPVEQGTPDAATDSAAAPPVRPRRFWRWFVREG